MKISRAEKIEILKGVLYGIVMIPIILWVMLAIAPI